MRISCARLVVEREEDQFALAFDLEYNRIQWAEPLQGCAQIIERHGGDVIHGDDYVTRQDGDIASSAAGPGSDYDSVAVPQIRHERGKPFVDLYAQYSD